ncbi:ATP-dependent DNA helicase Q1 isoform X1 [Alosa sapidissima]|uniref:ATP-dependent DNA helicase Q1 isoform X1 n=1 Tax=Alosa sapidissima TaxID=34773 RepID=UPI001C09090C|nr:ATP-dependent DNA helicase Q1 isoform X1 [Alosa sapidissima]
MENNSNEDEVQAELASVELELEDVEQQIASLLDRQSELNSRRARLLKSLSSDGASASPGSSQPSRPSLSKQELQSFKNSDFPWSKEVQEKLGSTFKLAKFRPLQLQAINLSMSGKDLFLVMPTGRGKSLCYQLPAVCSQGFTLVITPLVSLMEDQLMYLESVGVSAVCLNASSTKEHARSVMTGMTDKNCTFKLLYVTPEKIAKSKQLMAKLEKAYNLGLLARFAVDEVHCCSQWGHDFRPDYKLLGILKRQFPKVPLLGLTATATSSVMKDCQKILCIPDTTTLTAPFNRPNLFYEVRYKDPLNEDSISQIASLIKSRYKDQSGIVYVLSQKDAENVSADLQKQGISAQPYHANMEPSYKSRVHRHWTNKKVQVVVATVAFGMGIDKADVRFVIHHSMSKSIENYYQESGRAGRDDNPADCIVFYGYQDIFRIATMVVMDHTGQQKLHNMVAYCQNADKCRRATIAVHFDEVWDDEDCNEMCDICRQGNDCITVDITKHAREVLQIVELAGSLDEKVTPLKVSETWLGKGPAKRRQMIRVTALTRFEAEAIIVHLLLLGYLCEDYSFTPYTTYCYLKPGRKAALLKNEAHSITMKMKRTLPGGLQDSPEGPGDVTSANSVRVLDGNGRLDKIHKNHQNQARKEENGCVEIPSCEEPNLKVWESAAVIEVDVEINVIETNDVDKEGSEPKRVDPEPLKITAKRKSTTPKRRRRQAPVGGSVGASLPPKPPPLVNSPSRVSIISDTAAEELCDLQSYYNRQLRRINYVSHEHLQEAHPGVLTCIREPFRNLRLPFRSTITKSARDLWTRVSIRRKLITR